MSKSVENNAIRQLRLQWGLSQESFGEAVGVNRGTVINWEKAEPTVPMPIQETAIARLKADLESGVRVVRDGTVVFAENVAAVLPDEPTVSDPLEALFREGAKEQREWLWSYTGRVLRALADRMDATGAPDFAVPPGIIPTPLKRRSTDQDQTGTN